MTLNQRRSVMKTIIEEGVTYKVEYPFVRCKYNIIDGENYIETDGWKPGIIYTGECAEQEASPVAEGLGQVRMEVVSIHKPGKYPMRIFFLRSFVNPDGEEFGKGKLRITTAGNFTILCKGYRYTYEYDGEEYGQGY